MGLWSTYSEAASNGSLWRLNSCQSKFSLANSIWCGLRPPERYRNTLALVRPFGHVPHLIRSIIRSFQIYYFSSDFLMSFSYTFFQSFCSYAEVTMKFGSWPFAWDPRILLSFLWSAYIIFQGLFRPANLPIWQFCTTGGNGMYRDCIAFVVYSNSQATMNIMLPSPGLEELLSGQSHNILK